MIKRFYFLQFNLTFLCSQFKCPTVYIWKFYLTNWLELSGATSPKGTGSDDKEEILQFLQSFSITNVSPSDCLVSYPGDSLWVGSYPSEVMQSVYFAASVNWAHVGGILPLWRDAVGGFYNPSWLRPCWESPTPLQRCSRCVLQP